jgi:hypothetical protein
MDFRKFNITTKKDPLPFMDEVLDKVANHEIGSFMDDFLGYHKVKILLEDHANTRQHSLLTKVLSCGLSCCSTSKMPHEQVVSKALWEYLDVFMKLFLENFIVFNYMDTHVPKFRLRCEKCQEFNISFNLKNFFFVFSGIIIRFLVFQEGNLLNPIILKPLSICQFPSTPMTSKFLMV